MGRGRQEMGKGNERVRTCMSCLRLTCEVSSVPVYRNLDQTNFKMVSSVPVYRKLDQTNFTMVSSIPVYRKPDQTNFTMVSSVPMHRKLDQTNFIRRSQRSFVQET